MNSVIKNWSERFDLLGSQQLIGYVAFTIVLAGLFLVYDYDHILPKPPQTVHQWRQCDGNAQTMMLAYGRANLFKPATYHQGSHEGKAASEFPLMYQVNAVLIQLFGNRHLVTRLTTLLLFYLALFYLFRIGLHFTKNWVTALVPVILLHNIPVVAYYATTSLPNIPALSFLIIGSYHWFKYLESSKRWQSLVAVLFVSVAGLIKPTAVIMWIGLMLAVPWPGSGKPFRERMIDCSTMGAVLFGAMGLWVLHIKSYNEANESVVFLTNALPIWEMSAFEIDDTFRKIREQWFQDYAYWPMLIWIVLLSFPFYFKSRAGSGLFKKAMFFGLIGSIAYALLFFYQFHQHDYYVIELYGIIVASSVIAMYVLARVSMQAGWRMGLLLITIILLLLNIRYTDHEMHERYTLDASYNAFFLDFHALNPLLDEASLEWDDKVIVPSDPSPNISLYLMDQLGWTKFPDGVDSLKIEQWIDQGANHLVARQASFNQHPYLHHFSDSLLIEYKTLQVWTISSPQLPEKP